MKKIMLVILALVAVMAFNGCVPETMTGTPTTTPSYTANLPSVSGTAPTETITTAPTTLTPFPSTNKATMPPTTTQPTHTQPQLTASLPPPITQAPPSPTATSASARTAISINLTSGAPGSSVIITGSGFGANEAGIYVTFDGNPVESGITANAQGFWTATFVVPVSAFGSHTIHAYGPITTSAANVTFTTRPT